MFRSRVFRRSVKCCRRQTFKFKHHRFGATERIRDEERKENRNNFCALLNAESKLIVFAALCPAHCHSMPVWVCACALHSALSTSAFEKYIMQHLLRALSCTFLFVRQTLIRLMHTNTHVWVEKKARNVPSFCMRGRELVWRYVAVEQLKQHWMPYIAESTV